MLERILELVGTKHGAKKELTDALGLPSNLVTEWKQGRVKSYPKYAPQIADHYGVSMDWLSGKTDIKNTASNNADDARRNMLDAILNQLSDAGYEDVLWYARNRAEREQKK